MDASIIGIDVAKDRLDIHIRPDGRAVTVPRDADGLASLLELLRPLAPSLVGVEATGGFETVVAAALAGAGLPVVVVNPAQVRAFANALGRRAKTDPIDAAVIAHFLAATRPQVRKLPDAETRAFADLVANSSPSSTQSCATQSHGSTLDSQASRSPTGIAFDWMRPRCAVRSVAWTSPTSRATGRRYSGTS